MGVKRARRLIHQNDLRMDGKRAGDAQPLLLSAGKTECALFEPVLEFIPDGGILQARFDNLIQL